MHENHCILTNWWLNAKRAVWSITIQTIKITVEMEMSIEYKQKCANIQVWKKIFIRNMENNNCFHYFMKCLHCCDATVAYTLCVWRALVRTKCYLLIWVNVRSEEKNTLQVSCTDLFLHILITIVFFFRFILSVNMGDIVCVCVCIWARKENNGFNSVTVM